MGWLLSHARDAAARGGYARFVAIGPPGRRFGARIGQVPEAPLREYATPLHWDMQIGMRVR